MPDLRSRRDDWLRLLELDKSLGFSEFKIAEIARLPPVTGRRAPPYLAPLRTGSKIQSLKRGLNSGLQCRFSSDKVARCFSQSESLGACRKAGTFRVFAHCRPASEMTSLLDVEQRRPLRRQPNDQNFGSLVMLAVTAAAFLLVTWIATKGLFFFLQ